MRRKALCVLLISSAVLMGPGGIDRLSAAGTKKITYLVPSAINVLAFMPLVLAKHLGYFSDAGYDVTFVSAKGGVDVAKEVGVGNADVGTAIGDTPILVRGNGVPVKAVALLGGGALTSLVGRLDRGIRKIEDLRGKKISVLSFQDTTYYALLGTLSAVGIARQDVDIQAVGAGGVTNLVITGSVDACACVPERVVDIRNALPEVSVFSTRDFVPSMSQAVMASDDAIQKRPQMVRDIVAATLRGVQHIIADPALAAGEYVTAVPAYAGREPYVASVMRIYVEEVYGGQKRLGEMDAGRLQTIEDLYLKQGIIRTLTPVDQLFTNSLLP